ncbi:tetratricopeptide repeat protein [Thalassotalea piscium]
MKLSTMSCLLILILVVFSRHALAQTMGVVDNIKQVEFLFLQEKETLHAEEVLSLANNIIRKRHFYSTNTVAKVYILLANIAENKGDLGKSIQFARDGIALVGIDNVLKIDLLLKLAAGHYVEGHFHQVNKFAQQAVILSRQVAPVKYLLIALSYSAMSNALIANNSKAYQELKEISQLLLDNDEFKDHLDVIEILALAHLYQHDYFVAKTLYNKAIKLRFESGRMEAIDRSYYYLALIDLKLNRLDDAYSGFYQAKQLATKNQLPIRVAFADLGLGKVLLQQQSIQKSIEHLKAAEIQLQSESFGAPHLSALIALAKAYAEMDDKLASYSILERVEVLTKSIEVSYDQLELYSLLAEMYVDQNNYSKAFDAYKKQVTFYQQYYFQKPLFTQNVMDGSLDLQNRQIALNVAEHSDLRQSYFEKYQDAKKVIYMLITLLFILIVFSCYLYLNQRNSRLNKAYDDVEKPIDFIASPTQTKQMYQLKYKEARKFEYILSIGYLSIDNWQELTFRFNKKVVAEVVKTFGILINEYVSEFDRVGLIKDGEYLFISPHQSKESLQGKLNLLSNALKTRFFANLGDFSVKISYSTESPSVQDIDPFIFLSRLSESKRSEYATFNK